MPPTPTPTPTPTPPGLDGPQSLFARIGSLSNLLSTINLSRGTLVPSCVDEIQAQFSSTNQDIIDNLYSSLTSYQQSCSSFNSSIRSLASNTVIQMANDSLLLNNTSLNTALSYLIQQMKSSGQTVNQCTLSDSVAYAGYNIGNPNIVVSLFDVNNVLLEYCFAELITATCTQDAQSTPSLAGREIVNIQGQFSISDTFSYLYPEGSGASLNLQAVSGLQSGGGGLSNWLMNGSMETWSPTANGIPTSWHVETGTPGSTILQSALVFYDGQYSLQFAGNGSENTALYQQFSTPATNFDTITPIYPNTIFSVNLFARVNSTPASGVLRVGLWNGTSIIEDNSGAYNSFNIELNALSTNWKPFSGTFRTPYYFTPGLVIALELKLTTPLPSGHSVYIDRVAFSQMKQFYPGGPFVQIFSGNQNMIRGDNSWITINNNYGGLLQTAFNTLLGMRQLGMILPSSMTPTIPDSPDIFWPVCTPQGKITGSMYSASDNLVTVGVRTNCQSVGNASNVCNFCLFWQVYFQLGTDGQGNPIWVVLPNAEGCLQWSETCGNQTSQNLPVFGTTDYADGNYAVQYGLYSGTCASYYPAPISTYAYYFTVGGGIIG